MDKKTMLAAFAVGLVLLFLIEPFAIGMINATGKGGRAGEGGNASASSFTGTAVANITIVRYEPYLVVSGNASGMEAVKGRLVEEGRATYAVWSGDSLVVSLKSQKDVPAAAEAFGQVNASALATTYLSTSQKVTVVGDDGKIAEVEGMSISMQMRPLYEEGSVHEAAFAARVEGGQLTGIGQPSIAPTAVAGVPVEAKLSSQPSATYSVYVPWEGRAYAKPLALAANATYKERSFIYIANASKEQLDAAAAGMWYATGAQPGIISVQNGFVDRKAVEEELLARGYNATFPPSLASFGSAGGADALALVANLSAANMSAQLASDWTAGIVLPAVLVKDGRSYFGPADGIPLLIEGTGSPRENVTAMNVSVDLEAAGSRIVRVTAVNPQ